MLASLNRSAVLRFLWSFISIQSLQYWPALLRFSGIGEVNYLNHSPHWYCISSSIMNKLIDFDCLRMWSCRMSWTTPRSSMASDSPSRGSTGFAFSPFSFMFIVLESRKYMLSSHIYHQVKYFLYWRLMHARYKHKDMADLEKGLQESQDGRSRSKRNF